jgi:hypothetical protein
MEPFVTHRLNPPIPWMLDVNHIDSSPIRKVWVFRESFQEPEFSNSPTSFVLLVGRLGLDLGTLGLKEECGWSDWSGGVGLVCGKKRGIFESV